MLGWVGSLLIGMGFFPQLEDSSVPDRRARSSLVVERKQADCSSTGHGSGRGRVRNLGEAVLHSLHFLGEGQAHMGSGFTGRFRVS